MKEYAAGFVKCCEDHGVDADQLIKWAQSSEAMTDEQLEAELAKRRRNKARPGSVIGSSLWGASKGLLSGAGYGALGGGVVGAAPGLAMAIASQIGNNPEMSAKDLKQAIRVMKGGALVGGAVGAGILAPVGARVGAGVGGLSRFIQDQPITIRREL